MVTWSYDLPYSQNPMENTGRVTRWIGGFYSGLELFLPINQIKYLIINVNCNMFEIKPANKQSLLSPEMKTKVVQHAKRE